MNQMLVLKFNIEKAKEYLNRSRYGKKRPRVVLMFNTSEDQKRVAENIQMQLKNKTRH